MVDSQGLVLPGATVRITNVTSRRQARGPDHSGWGVYRAPSLAAGTYTIEVELDGFNKAVRQAVNVGISETARVDFQLLVSGVAESVTVAGVAPLIETEQGRVSGRVDRQQMQEMPLSGRNLYNLIPRCSRASVGRGLSSSISGGGGADDSLPASRRRESTPAASATRRTPSRWTTRA